MSYLFRMSPPRPDGDARRQALLDAALLCFDARGLVETGIEDIRKAAGASPSSVYHLFDGLPAIIAALLEQIVVDRFGEITPRVLAARTARTAVMALVDAHLSWTFAHAAKARFLYRALALDQDGGHRAELRAKKEELKAELVAHLRSLGALGAKSPAETTLEVLILGPTHEACRRWLSSAPAPFDQTWMRKTLPELAWQTARSLL